MTTDGADLDLPAIREKYLLLREAQRELNNRLQTMLPKQAYKDCGKQLGFWQRGQLVFEHEDHVGVLTDFMIYDYRIRGGTNAVERLWRLRADEPETVEHEVLRAMQAARFTVMRVHGTVPGTGAVVEDLFYGSSYFLADVTFSENTEPGAMIAARALPFTKFVMTTGAALGVTPAYIDNLIDTMTDRHEETFPEMIRSFGVAERTKVTAGLIRSLTSGRPSHSPEGLV
jgi:hypothetical protein